MGQKLKKEKKRRERKERLNDGKNNGQVKHGARKHAWRMQAAWANSIDHINVWTFFLCIVLPIQLLMTNV